MTEEQQTRLERMFEPRGVAVFGGVHRPGSFGRAMLQCLIRFGYAGRLYPVAPEGGEAFGLRIHKTLAEAGGPVDLASISVPAQAVPQVLADCLAHGVAGVEIHSSGFAETGEPEGRALEEAVKGFAAQGLRIVGPNCFGILSPAAGLSFLPAFDVSRRPGPVSLISQSGGLANDFAHEAVAMGLGLDRVISFGNGADLAAQNLLEHLGGRRETGVVGAYLEGVKDGRAFMETLDQVTRVKPVVVYKGGLTPPGGRATASHTGSLAGSAGVWRGVLAQAGAVAVEGLEGLLDAITALCYTRSRGRRVALIGGGGAIGVQASDLAHRLGLSLPPFSAATRRRLAEILPPPGNSVANPLDTGSPMLPPETLLGLVEEVMAHEDVDAVVLVLLLHPLEVVSKALMSMEGMEIGEGAYLGGVLPRLAELRRASGKDLVVVLENRATGEQDVGVEQTLRRLRPLAQALGLAVYPNTPRALSGLAAAARARRVTGA